MRNTPADYGGRDEPVPRSTPLIRGQVHLLDARSGYVEDLTQAPNTRETTQRLTDTGKVTYLGKVRAELGVFAVLLSSHIRGGGSGSPRRSILLQLDEDEGLVAEPLQLVCNRME